MEEANIVQEIDALKQKNFESLRIIAIYIQHSITNVTLLQFWLFFMLPDKISFGIGDLVLEKIVTLKWQSCSSGILRRLNRDLCRRRWRNVDDKKRRDFTKGRFSCLKIYDLCRNEDEERSMRKTLYGRVLAPTSRIIAKSMHGFFAGSVHFNYILPLKIFNFFSSNTIRAISCFLVVLITIEWEFCSKW